MCVVCSRMALVYNSHVGCVGWALLVFVCKLYMASVARSMAESSCNLVH